MKKIMFLTVALMLGFTLEAHAVLWEYNLGSALKKAKTAQKPVMVDFYTDWCGWCKKLDSDTYSSPKVNQLAKNFICVKVDADKNKDAVAQYHVEGYPTIIFLNYEGGIDDRVVGYRDAGGFAEAMDSVLKKTKGPAARKQEEHPSAPPPSAGSGLRPSTLRQAQGRPEQGRRTTSSGLRETGGAAVQGQEKAKFVLNGIFYDATAPVALINGTPLKVGDTIEGAKVKKITKVDVELEYEEKPLILSIR